MENNAPKISVIVPVYKTEQYLEKCVNSILAQTFKDFELILVDDGSPDKCGEICDIFAQKDNRIKVIHKENGGLTSARISGFDIAKGEYISFIDSDDYVHIDFLLKLITVAEESNAELCICAYYLVNSNDEKAVFLPYTEKIINKNEITDKYILPLIGRIFDGSHINLPGFMWLRLLKKNSLRHQYFVSEHEVFTEDDIFNILYAEQINNIGIVNEPLYYYVQHPESLTNRYREGKLRMLQNRYSYCEKWLKEHNLSEYGKERLIAASVSAVNASIDNAIMLNDFELFKDEIKEIKSSKLYNESYTKVNIKSMAMTQKLNYFLLRFNLIWLLYTLRKARLNK